MAYKEVLRVEISEVIRCWQAGHSRRNVASGTGLSKDTVGKYISAAEVLGICRDGAPPGEEELSRLAVISRSGPRRPETPTEDLLAPWADRIYRWLTGDRLQVTRIQELLAARDCPVSYASLQRFIQRRNWRRRHPATVRMADTAPGEVVELDFGRLGLVLNPDTGRRRTVWALVLVLGYSRHCFVWPTFSQKLEDVIAGLETAWAFFGGIPKYLVIDNFPAAMAGADALHPRLTRGFLEYSQHRGFICDPARVRHPKNKPKVERGIQYVRERFFKGGEFRELADVREQAQRWCRDVAGHRIHGTTYHVACQYALYSVPSSLCPPGQQVEIGLGSKLARIYHPSTGSGRQADQDPRPPAQGWPRHRSRGLPGGDHRLHDACTGQDQAQRRGARPGGGRIRRAAVRWATPLGQGQTGPQAHPLGAALHPRAPRRRLPQSPGNHPQQRGQPPRSPAHRDAPAAGRLP